MLINELRRDEGVRPSMYADNCKASPLPDGWKCPLTDQQINTLLAADIDLVCKDLDRIMPWWRGLDEVRQRVLANMAFNMGAQGLAGFKNTLQAVRAGQYSKAASGMLASKWASQVKGRAQRLATAMQTGVMPA